MSDLERFQKQFGPDWSAIVSGEAFAAAMTLLNSEKIQGIAELTDEEIATRGQIILADLRGHLKHENALLGLHQIKKFVFQSLPSEEYHDPAEEALREQERREAGGREGDGADGDDQQRSEFPFPPAPPPKVAPEPAPRPREKKKLPAKKKPRKIRAKR